MRAPTERCDCLGAAPTTAESERLVPRGRSRTRSGPADLCIREKRRPWLSCETPRCSPRGRRPQIRRGCWFPTERRSQGLAKVDRIAADRRRAVTGRFGTSAAWGSLRSRSAAWRCRLFAGMAFGEQPSVRYAKSSEGYLAYDVLGGGSVDLVRVLAGPGISIDAVADEPHWERFDARLASFARLIRFDRRGIGLSDGASPATPPTVEQNVQDAVAVLDAAGSTRAAVFGPEAGGMVAAMLCATHPERASHLVLYHSSARALWAPDYPRGLPWSELELQIDAFCDPDAPSNVEQAASVLATDPQIQAWWARAHRQAASPATTRAQLLSWLQTDIRPVLSAIRTPTLVLHRPECAYGDVAHSRYLAEHIPGARYVELPGSDELCFAGDADAVLDEIEEFITGTRSSNPVADRVLTTVLFTDIVGSTARAAALGDRAWRDRLDAHDAMVRRQLERFRGREVNTTGDGFLATFDGPARAIHCGWALRDGTRQLGVDVRVGVHTGEVELRGDDVGGITVHIGQRICGAAQPGEVLVSSAVKDLVAGSGIGFTERGQHELKGVPGEWRLFGVTGP